MSYDIYSGLKQKIDELERKFLSGKIVPIQYIEEVTLLYKLACKYSSDYIEIECDFKKFVKKFLNYIENEMNKNVSIKQNNFENIALKISNSIDKLKSYFNFSSFECYDEINSIINSAIVCIVYSNNIKNFKIIVDYLLNNINSVKILTEDYIKEDIMPILDRINEIGK